MSLNQFIDTGADNATVNDMKKSIAREEDLQKAMNRAGLVQKEVQVKGKNGQMFTRKQWVKASDDQNAGISNKNATKLSPRGQRNLKRALQNRDDFVDVREEYKKEIADKQKELKSTKNGFVAKTRKLEIEELQSELSYIEAAVENDDADAGTISNKGNTKSSSDTDSNSSKKDKGSTKLDPFQVGGNNVTHYVNRKKYPPTGFSSASLAGKNIGEVLSGQSKEFVSKGAKDEAIRATKEAIRSHKKGLKDPNYRDSLYSESKEKQIIEAATELLAKLEEIPVRGQSQSKSDDKTSSGKFKPSDFQFRSGGQVVADFVNSIDKELGVKKHTNGNVGFGTLSLENGASVNFGYDDTGAYATWNGSNFRDVKSLKSAMSGQKSDQGKMNHQTGIREKKAATMIEDYFAGNHSHEDGKKALAGLLGKGYSREDIMAQAEKSGVTWKKNDHAGINWMRASMAIQKHLNSLKNSSNSSSTPQYNTGTVDKNGNLKPTGDNELSDMVEELTGMDLPEVTHLVRVTNDLDISSGSSDIESAKVLSNGKLQLKVYLEGYDENSEENIDDTFIIEIPVNKH